ncbi:plasmid partitioning protein RepB [Alphaproteobacteria bacterium GH1-50]|uniref:Plasmid partitioning protein RepB n=1 Tax=Kangsaoukella pontilimi TaxID=2691042 RepID=A0A7C9MZ79_9RHOB|nr:plasmid partitioning protein RepB [Kangsaoukella pontilimi]MXQ09714.1 plasmid partitioning protein RepB [Kangsaoukella pontilimi]
MNDSRKKRMSMLDTLASAAPATAPSMMATNRALRSARDAVDAHHVWELDPAAIVDNRPTDRLDTDDVDDLRDAIEANGQTVPILVRRDPTDPERFHLVYGRRRLEAIRLSDKIDKVRAIVTSMNDDDALRAQISENMARRDLTFIEKALFARTLVDEGFGTQAHIAEVLTVTKSAISMALAVVDSVGVELVRAIGAAPGIGRPRWEALARDITASRISEAVLIDVAERAYVTAEAAVVLEDTSEDLTHPSVAAFEAVAAEVARPEPVRTKDKPDRGPAPLRRDLVIDGERAARLTRTKTGLRLDLPEGGFADWLDRHSDKVIQELHDRWKTGAED